MEKIQACVNPRLLAKAQRLFTGTRDGRIIELLQNARRAGATEVEIVNASDQVTVRDNGRGVDDFAKLLDLGGSGWIPPPEGGVDLEASEDPAGVGLFCLSPRKVTIRSRGRQVVISGDGWTGQAVAVLDYPQAVQGTELVFQDEPWDRDAVEKHAVFSGLTVKVDGGVCAWEPFLQNGACATYSELGCRIQVRPNNELNEWHRRWREGHGYPRVLVNFHGQVVGFDYQPVNVAWLTYLVELTGQPTGIRLMLPARTRLVQNTASEALQAAIEVEAYRYFQRQSLHHLSFAEFERARVLGVELPEAEPDFEVGLLERDDVSPSEVHKPKNFPLSQCYRLAPQLMGHNSTHTANAHLLAALGVSDLAFVPVTIDQRYDGYSWAKVPLIERVEVRTGKVLHQGEVWMGRLTCVESIELTVHASDGKVFKSSVPLAIAPPEKGKEHKWHEPRDWVLVTLEARRRLDSSEIWFHLGGFSDEGDTYDTQSVEADRQLRAFWCELVGPDEELRVNIFETVEYLAPAWKRITILPGGDVAIAYADGRKKRLKVPKAEGG